MSSPKQRAAAAALAYLKPDTVLGVGTGSTVNFFIDALAAHRDRIPGAVSSVSYTHLTLPTSDLV